MFDSGKAEPVDPDFFGQEPSLDYKESFEPKSSFLDLVVQKLRASIGLMYSPFLGSFIDIYIRNGFYVAIKYTRTQFAL